MLAHWCLRSRGEVAGRSVLELGAGTGLAGLACALCGARGVALSDGGRAFPHVLDNLRRVVELNAARRLAAGAEAMCPVRVADVGWGRFTPELLHMDPPDVILAADCLYDSKGARGGSGRGGEAGVRALASPARCGL